MVHTLIARRSDSCYEPLRIRPEPTPHRAFGSPSYAIINLAPQNNPRIEQVRRCIVRVAVRWQSDFFLIIALGAAAGAAQPVRGALTAEADFYVSLRYEVADSVRECWDEVEFRRSIANQIGYDPFRDDASVIVLVRVGGTVYAVDGMVEWRKEGGVGMGERRFAAKDGNCSNLLTEMSFAIGLQIDLLRATPPTAAGPSASSGGSTAAASAHIAAATAPSSAEIPTIPPQTAPPPAASPPEATPAHDLSTSAKDRRPSETAISPAIAPAEGDSPHWTMWVGIGPSLAWDISPSITANARLFLGVRRSEFSLELGGEASYPTTLRQWDGSGFRQSLIGASATVCGHLGAASACLVGKASQVRVTGLGVDQPRSPTGFVAQAGLRLAAAMDLGGPWFATAHIDALGLLTPNTIVLSQAGVWDMPRLGALAGIDLAARFR